ncbi:MAG: radical SAM protein [Planctomycetes bacterium]|nr:radical SAM protein [Planctomycetota bacterium]
MPLIPAIPPLLSGGVMLSWSCTCACRHCLYRCSTGHTNKFMSEDMIDKVFSALSEERSLSGVHIAGGEATLNWDRLEYALKSANKHGVRIDYLETNASWCSDYETAREGFNRLQDAGLEAVLISASLFHNEFIPLKNTTNGINAARDTFGYGGVIVWTPTVYELMKEHLEDNRTHTLRESCQLIGLTPETGDIWRLHNYLTPGGRAAESLKSGLERFPPEHFIDETCAASLERTGHFHISPEGHLFTGHCPGISVGKVGDFHPEITAENAPVFRVLYEKGPCGLMELAKGEFKPSEDGYIGKCHLCLDIRKFLHKTGRFPDLCPPEFYEAI